MIFKILFLISVFSQPVFAEESVQPYIDLLKRTMDPEEVESSPVTDETYLQQQKKIIEETQNETPLKPGESYINQLKNTDPVLIENAENQTAPQSGSYTEQQKALLEPKGPESAIEKVQTGKSELKLERPGEISGAWGFRIGTGIAQSQNITASSSTSRSFTDVYGTGFNPNISLFYEFQPLHHDWVGALGIQTGVGVTFHKGTGEFQTALNNPKTGSSFGSSSRTQMNFLTFPLSAGAVYRFHLLRVLRPFVYVGGNLIPYFETRSDSRTGHRGFSLSAEFRGGLSFMLDFLSDTSSWELYDVHGIKHFYLTAEYIKQLPFNGNVRFEVSGLFLGFMAEY